MPLQKVWKYPANILSCWKYFICPNILFVQNCSQDNINFMSAPTVLHILHVYNISWQDKSNQGTCNNFRKLCPAWVTNQIIWYFFCLLVLCTQSQSNFSATSEITHKGGHHLKIHLKTCQHSTDIDIQDSWFQTSKFMQKI